MAQELTRKRAIIIEGAYALGAKASWQQIALAAVLVLSAFPSGQEIRAGRGRQTSPRAATATTFLLRLINYWNIFFAFVLYVFSRNTNETNLHGLIMVERFRLRCDGLRTWSKERIEPHG
jgi:hypothetical protein